MCLDFLDDIPVCNVCGLNYDELIIAKLTLISGETVTKYLCEDCLSKIRRIIK